MVNPRSAGFLGVLLVPLTLISPLSLPPGDPDLYVSAGCASCHGPSAGGAYGPTLAGTELSFDAFLRQLREPRGVMPAVPESFVSDVEARTLFDFVRGLGAPEGGAVAESGCRKGAPGPGFRGRAGMACRFEASHGTCRHGACRHGACRGSRSPGR